MVFSSGCKAESGENGHSPTSNLRPERNFQFKRNPQGLNQQFTSTTSSTALIKLFRRYCSIRNSKKGLVTLDDDWYD
ncbi:hypothetical protein M569_00129 [Genlisea aurea]|uniref:Uncharacterized protein n=1 Tax=Genlisea aurea TaxID=192259 RepID=S8D5F4_9LAMI|nr:hypothetical protein M569_00129 [Genlisea aurea]